MVLPVTMVLPVDVVDHIFSFLREDLATLKLCIQAHPLLSGIAERHLYHTTNLGCDLDITQLSSLLEKNPRIRNCIRSLGINISHNAKSLVSAQTPVIKALSSILSSLPGLNKVTLSNLSWTITHTTFRTPFINILQQSSVTEVHLESIYAFPLFVLNACQNIKTLSLSNCEDFKRFELTPSSHHLESLAIRSSDSPGLFDWAINRIGSLTSLKLRPQNMEFSALPKILEACAASLTSLELDMHDLGQIECFSPDDNFYSQLSPDISFGFPFTLSPLSNLQKLTIWTQIDTAQEEIFFDGGIQSHDFVFYSAIPAIAQLIGLSAPSLRRVVLNIYCCEFSDIESLVEFDWSPLILLGDSPTCPHIELCVSVKENGTGRRFSPEEITNTLPLCPGLMWMVNLGVFSIKAETEDSG